VNPVQLLDRPAKFVASQARAFRVLGEAGMLHPSRPDRLLAAGLALHRWGLSLPGISAASAARYPEAVAVIDDDRRVTYAEFDGRTNALANALEERGLRESDRVGVLCRNHAGFAESVIALTKLGSDVTLLNTGLAEPQIHAVIEREGITAIVHDATSGPSVAAAIRPRRRFVADSGRPGRGTTLQRLIEHANTSEPRPPRRQSSITILTSGTTGAPRGASRSQPATSDPAVSVLSSIPLRARGTTVIAAPLFHAWGFAHLALGLALSSTAVLRRQFDPEQTLADVEKYHATALVAVPLMLRRILDLPAGVRKRYETSSLRVVAVSGSALPGDLADAFMDEFGDVVYNLYGSTEVATATIATPADLRAAPGTAGRPPRGTLVRVVDDRGNPLPQGAVGRIFVGNDALIESYADGEVNEMIDGLMETGDVGHFDSEGRLFLDGRSDEMIVSGGENVYPVEVEALLMEHPDIVDAAVVRVADEEWGQRLAAFVVRRRGARLSVDDVKGYVRMQLARHKVPRDVHFVRELPRNPTGKVVKSALTAPIS